MSKIKDHFITDQEPPESMAPDPDYELYQEVHDILKGKSDKAITDEHEEAVRTVHKRMVG